MYISMHECTVKNSLFVKWNTHNNVYEHIEWSMRYQSRSLMHLNHNNQFKHYINQFVFPSRVSIQINVGVKSQYQKQVSHVSLMHFRSNHRLLGIRQLLQVSISWLNMKCVHHGFSINAYNYNEITTTAFNDIIIIS